MQRRLKSQKWLEDAIKYKLTFPQICSSNGSKHWTSSTGMQHDRHRLGSVCGILFNQCYLLKQSTTSAESSSSTPVINGCNVNTVACGIPGQVSWLVACVFSILVAGGRYCCCSFVCTHGDLSSFVCNIVEPTTTVVFSWVWINPSRAFQEITPWHCGAASWLKIRDRI